MERIYNKNDAVEFLVGLPQNGVEDVYVGGCVLIANRYNGGFSCKLKRTSGVVIKTGSRDEIIKWLGGEFKICN